MPPHPSKRRNRPVSLDPKSLTLAELNALPRNSLILLASARNLVTTGTKTRLAQCVYEHERVNSNQTQVTGPRHPAPPTSNATPEVFTDADPPLRSPDLQQGQQPSSGSPFSHDQLSKLREIIAEVIGPQWKDYDQAPGLPTDVLPLPPPAALTACSITPRDRSHRASHKLSKMAAHHNTNWCLVSHRLPRVLPLSCIWVLKTTSLCLHRRSKIAKHEYIHYNDLLSDNMYPHPSYTSSQNNFTLTVNPQDATTLAFVPSQRKKRRINGISSWLEAWNVFLISTLSLYPQLPPDLLAYQDQVCKFSRKFKASAWLMYDTAFRYMAASNTTLTWAKVNEQLYNDILKKKTLPYCINCHTYGHHTLACSMISRSAQSFHFYSATSTTTGQTHTLASTPIQPTPTQPLQQGAICRDFNHCACRHPNCQFRHICNKPDCGGNHPGSQCPQAKSM